VIQQKNFASVEAAYQAEKFNYSPVDPDGNVDVNKKEKLEGLREAISKNESQ